jgi:hypothetical protein
MAKAVVENGQEVFTFDPDTHTGRMGDDVWPSVTQLLQEFGIIDYSRVPFETLERKRLIGIRVDRASSMLDNCSLDEDHFNANFPECIPYLEGYRKFRVIEKFEPSEKEARYFSRKWRFHGAPDEYGVRLGNYGGEPALIDYKCTWKMYESCGPQLAGYAMLIYEALKVRVKLRFGLLLKPTGHYDLYPFKDPNDFQDFKACLWLHWAKRNKYKTTKGVLTDGNFGD